LSEDDFYTPTDIDMLRMENELLAFEVRFLKTRLGRSGRGLGISTPLSRISYLAEAKGDLVLLLRRLGRPPLNLIFGRRRSFRTLQDRYLSEEDGTSSNEQRNGR
jgi:hypothetical protein